MILLDRSAYASKLRRGLARTIASGVLIAPIHVSGQTATGSTATGAVSDATTSAFEAAINLPNANDSDAPRSVEDQNDAASGGVTLPESGGPSAMGSRSIALPSGSGTPLGMGESFSAQLSTGLATYSVPISLPAARGEVQPSLRLSYSSSSGSGIAGVGWNIGVAAISRKTDHGLPKYDDRSDWHPNQDRFSFEGSELVPICVVAGGACSAALSNEVMPSWADGWQYFRMQIESRFFRFFWSPDHRTWRVQAPDGSSLEFGVPLDNSGYELALENNPDNSHEIVRWHLVRQYDTHGAVQQASNPMPRNVVVYRYLKDGNVVHLSDIYDTTPAADPSTSNLPDYAHHTRLVYAERPDKLVSYRAGWRSDHRLRLVRIDVTAKSFESGSAPRQLLRRYRLDYDWYSHSSLLTRFYQEGRCGISVEESSAGSLPETACPTLPGLKFEYQRISSDVPPVTDSLGLAFEPFATKVRELSNSPPHSLGQMETGLLDINADSLPDVVVTSAALYKGAHALFLNGANGALEFGTAQALTVTRLDGVDAGILKLSNTHVSVLDLDGDGQINLVHMPDYQRYTVFSPSFDGANWSWSPKSVAAPTGQSVKIDWTKNAERTAVMDVNGDGLVDIVSASSTELQTFFSLGRFPGGEHQFGQAEWSSATEAKLSTEPVRSCIPWSAAPVRFGDQDVHIADMNGDGLPDIVRIRSGQVLYWPGRGNGTWGTGTRNDCAAGSFGSDRAIEMQNAPALNPLESSEFFASDVNGDGLTDLVKVRANAVDLYLNENGLRFTSRGLLSNTPIHPNSTRRVALTDINGSGTPDIVWGEAHNYRYVDLTDGVQPLLLKRVSNGLGAATEFDYSTSTQLMLAARAAGTDWSSVMPIVVPVVVRSTVRDNLDKAGRPLGAVVTEYQYRNPIFDGKKRDFRGFRETVVRALGDANSPTSLKRFEFLLGHPSDDKATNGMTSEAQDAPWREVVKGVPIVEEELDETGVALFTRHTGMSIKALYRGLDGRRVLARKTSTSNLFSYDTANFSRDQSTVTLTDYSIDIDGASRSSTRQLELHSTTGTAQVRSAVVQDDFGNVTTTLKEGCISGCPNGADEAITTTSVFARPPGETSGWIWLETESYITGSLHPSPRHHRGKTYNAFGDVVEVHAWLSGTLPLQRSMANPPAPPNASDGQTSEVLVSLSETTYDGFGNAAFVQGPNGACHAMELDPLYAQLLVADHLFAGAASYDGCGDRMFTTTGEYDRGLGQPTSVISARNQPSSVQFDGFGRVVAEFGPSLASPGTLDPIARKKYEYYPTTDAVTQPYSVLRALTIDEDASGIVSYAEQVSYVDGLGRVIYALSEADPSAGDGGSYVLSGDQEYNAKGMPRLSHEPEFYSGTAIPFPIDRRLTTKTKSQVYDAFGRVKETYLQDGQLKARAEYHALGGDSFDAGDLSVGSRFSGTYSSHFNDGHGRPAIGVSRYRVNNTTIEEHRATLSYLPSGEVVQLVRQRAGSPDFVRRFQYDTWGRMVLNVEPNTSGTTGSGATAVTKAWRYAYDDASRLVGTSDANGCGVNYHYDAGGRLIGSDYLPCKTNHVAYSMPNPSTGDGFETYYRYDESDPLATNIADAAGQTLSVESTWLWGRLASSKTRGGFNVFAYDALGRTVGVARRLTKPDNQSSSVSERYAPRWYIKQSTFDILGRPKRVSTGAPLLALFGPDGTSEQRTTYTRRGLVRSVDSSYGTLVARETRDARGLLQDVVFGDLAQTTRSYTYNDLTQVTDVTTYRAPPALWTSSASPYTTPPTSPSPTTQLTLEHYEFLYDVVGNLTQANDWRTASDWPDANRPVMRTWEYDSYSRLTRATYTYPSTSNTTWQSPFAPENTSSTLEPRPARQVSFGSRTKEETFSYDWLNNLVSNTDDSDGFYDRSLGASNFGDGARPHRLTSASNRATSATRKGELAAAYDDVGQVVAIVLQRDGTCLPTGASCWARFGYEWDEVGNLTRARRWDLAAGTERTTYGSAASVNATHPTRSPDVELHYQYDGGVRVVKSVARSTGTKYTVYPFPSLELRNTTLSGSGATQDYALSSDTTQVRLSTNSVAARVLYNATMPRTGASNVHLLLEFGDHLGSTTFVVDHATSELVEYATYTSYGQTENDYRNTRWSNFRESYRFTGQEEDIEVGLNYHGARYYSPALKRWMSADPVTIHEMGSDFNPYSYGYGNPTAYLDPDGRDPFLAALVVGAVVGAILSSATYIATTPSRDRSLAGLARAAVVGAVSGAAGGVVGYGMTSAMATLGTGTWSTIAIGAGAGVAAGAAGGGTGYFARQLYDGKPLTDRDFFEASGMGALWGAVGGALGAAAVGLNHLNGVDMPTPAQAQTAAAARSTIEMIGEGVLVAAGQGAAAYTFLKTIGADDGLAWFGAGSAALNGLITGVRGTYNWKTCSGWAAAALDATTGLTGTTVGHVQNLVQCLAGGEFSWELSYRQNRQVYDGGVGFKKGYALTLGNVTGNFHYDATSASAPSQLSLLNNHESLHGWQSRALGPIFEIGQLTWVVGGGIVGGIAGLSNNAFTSAGYMNSPFEWQAYRENGGWPYRSPDVLQKYLMWSH